MLSGVLKNDFDVILIDANTLGYSSKKTLDLIKKINPLGVVFAFGNSVKKDDYEFYVKFRGYCKRFNVPEDLQKEIDKLFIE